MSTYHTPVLLPSVLSQLNITPGAWYIDATLGGGGYTTEILRRGGNVLGIDVDPEALAYTKKRIETEFTEKKEGVDWILVHSNFSNIEAIGKEYLKETPTGILFDLGISSHQIDTEQRGISFRFPDAFLDFRMDQSKGEPFYEVLSRLSSSDLEEIIARYGEEPYARKISFKIVQDRQGKTYQTVKDIRQTIESVVPSGAKDSVTARVFQAFRIYQNDELAVLREGLQGAVSLLASNGRLVCISFHSLEDRIVKQFLIKSGLEILTKQPVVADEEERFNNSRSRSAKLRAGEKKQL